jgi:hypothetical protein
LALKKMPLCFCHEANECKNLLIWIERYLKYRELIIARKRDMVCCSTVLVWTCLDSVVKKAVGYESAVLCSLIKSL